MKRALALSAILFCMPLTVPASLAAEASKKCIWVDSYHQGYGWSDGIGRGIQKTLKGKCDLSIFRMDTKRHNDVVFIQKKGEEAKAFIEAQKPDLVIVSDDNATDAVLMKYFRNHRIPFVFAGLNWSIERYGLPYKNTTGMIEVSPIKPMIDELKKSKMPFKSAHLIFPDNETGRKEADQVSKIFKGAGIAAQCAFAKTMEEFKRAWTEGQSRNFVYFDNTAGINDWNNKAMAEWILEHTRKPSSGIYEWVAPFVSFAMAKSPEEQGKWAGEAAVKILEGRAPNSLPIVTNRKYDPFMNRAHLRKVGLKLSAEFTRRAKAF